MELFLRSLIQLSFLSQSSWGNDTEGQCSKFQRHQGSDKVITLLVPVTFHQKENITIRHKLPNTHAQGVGKYAWLSWGERKRFLTTQEVPEDPFLPLRELKPTEWPVCCMGPAGRNRCRVKRRETHLKELQDPSSVAAGQSQEGKEHFPGSEGQVVKEQRGQAISAEEAARPSGA